MPASSNPETRPDRNQSYHLLGKTLGALPARCRKFLEHTSVLMLSRRWIAPMTNALHREKERGRRTKRSFPGVPSTAANFELLMSLAEEMPRENASSCDPDKPMMQPQENTMRSASAIVCAVRSAFGAATDVVGRSLRERRGIAARKGLRALPSRATSMLALLSNRLGTPKRLAANIEPATICAWPASES